MLRIDTAEQHDDFIQRLLTLIAMGPVEQSLPAVEIACLAAAIEHWERSRYPMPGDVGAIEAKHFSSLNALQDVQDSLHSSDWLLCGFCRPV